MKKLLMLVLACYGLSAGAQVRQNKNFLYLYSDSVIYAHSVKLRPDLFSSLELRADSRHIPLQQIKFFNNEDGFFANTRKLTFGNQTEFAERVIEGKMNLYQQVYYDPYIYDSGYRFRNRRREVANVRMFYNKGYGDLKKINYRNLRGDMADDPQSLDLLENYHKSIKISRALYIAGGASLAASFITFVVNGIRNVNNVGKNSFSNGYPSFQSGGPSRDSKFTIPFVLLGLGTGFTTAGFVVGGSGSRRLEQAVDSYNR